MNKVKKILIIRLDRIGDTILSTPALRAVRQMYPEAIIHLLVTEYNKDVVINNPNIDQLLVYKKDSLENDYDAAIALHPGIQPNYLTFVSGARFRVGYKGRGGSFFLTHKLIDDRETRLRHEVDSNLETVEVIGCKTEDKKLDISITKEGEEFAAHYFEKENLSPGDLVVAIHSGSGEWQEYVRWRNEGFAEVADKLIKDGNTKVILIGGSKEGQLVNEIISRMKGKPLFAADLSLTELISLIKRCSLFIGNCTGPMHIAAALGVPVVVIFGVIHPLDSWQAWGPWGRGHIVVSKNLRCRHCHPSDCRTFDCLRLISAQEVFEAAQKQLDNVRKYDPR